MIMRLRCLHVIVELGGTWDVLPKPGNVARVVVTGTFLNDVTFHHLVLRELNFEGVTGKKFTRALQLHEPPPTFLSVHKIGPLFTQLDDCVLNRGSFSKDHLPSLLHGEFVPMAFLGNTVLKNPPERMLLACLEHEELFIGCTHAVWTKEHKVEVSLPERHVASKDLRSRCFDFLVSYRNNTLTPTPEFNARLLQPGKGLAHAMHHMVPDAPSSSPPPRNPAPGGHVNEQGTRGSSVRADAPGGAAGAQTAVGAGGSRKAKPVDKAAEELGPFEDYNNCRMYITDKLRKLTAGGPPSDSWDVFVERAECTFEVKDDAFLQKVLLYGANLKKTEEMMAILVDRNLYKDVATIKGLLLRRQPKWAMLFDFKGGAPKRPAKPKGPEASKEGAGTSKSQPAKRPAASLPKSLPPPKRVSRRESSLLSAEPEGQPPPKQHDEPPPKPKAKKGAGGEEPWPGDVQDLAEDLDERLADINKAIYDLDKESQEHLDNIDKLDKNMELYESHVTAFSAKVKDFGNVMNRLEADVRELKAAKQAGPSGDTRTPSAADTRAGKALLNVVRLLKVGLTGEAREQAQSIMASAVRADMGLPDPGAQGEDAECDDKPFQEQFERAIGFMNAPPPKKDKAKEKVKEKEKDKKKEKGRDDDDAGEDKAKKKKKAGKEKAIEAEGHLGEAAEGQSD